MIEFTEIRHSTKAEQVRAFAVERAIDLRGTGVFADKIVPLAAEIERFILNGEQSANPDPTQP